MTMWQRVQTGLFFGMVWLALAACSAPSPSRDGATASPTFTLEPRATLLPPTVTVAPTLPPPTLTPTPDIALSEVQFALDVDETGQLVYPADEFVHGITRVYVRFVYQGLAELEQVASVWSLNQNPVVSDTLTWDGGDAGHYVIWMEDPNGIGRGTWRWALQAARCAPGATQCVVGETLGSGTFVISGEPGYLNEAWDLSFDPPAGWSLESEVENYATFSSSDQRGALALRLAPLTASLTETLNANLAPFQESDPQAQVVLTQTLTMGGTPALLQGVRYTGQEGTAQLLYVAVSSRDDVAYSLWMLGPASEAERLRTLLNATLRSLRFGVNE